VPKAASRPLARRSCRTLDPLHTMSMLVQTQRLSDALYSLFDGRSTPSATRQFLAAGAHDAVHEHHRAIGFLVREQLCGSAFVLRRAMFDGCLRGLWLTHIATDTEVDRFAAETYDPKPVRVLAALKTLSISGAETLRQFYEAGWKAMSSYTHGGFRQVVGRLGVGFVGASYTAEELDSLLQHANWFALLSAIELSEISKDVRLQEEVVALGERYVARVV